jgi:phosphoribosyl 1,2-cyclic phosphate phosphodiesterase
MKDKLLFLGTGGSMGVPMIGCHCEVCRSDSPFDKRMRASVLVTIGGKRLLIDCGPDFHQQALRYHLDTLDGVLITHAHHDHTASIDELRVYPIHTKQPIPCLLSKQTADELTERFAYIFKPHPPHRAHLPKISLQYLEGDRGMTDYHGVKVRYMTYEQLGMKVNGFRFGDLAYVTDIRVYPETIFEDLAGVDTLILSALRFTPNEFHFTIDEAIDFAKKVGAKMTWLTHIAHDLKHDKIDSYLPSNVRLAYDGLEISFVSE